MLWDGISLRESKTCKLKREHTVQVLSKNKIKSPKLRAVAQKQVSGISKSLDGPFVTLSSCNPISGSCNGCLCALIQRCSRCLLDSLGHSILHEAAVKCAVHALQCHYLPQHLRIRNPLSDHVSFKPGKEKVYLHSDLTVPDRTSEQPPYGACAPCTASLLLLCEATRVALNTSEKCLRRAR